MRIHSVGQCPKAQEREGEGCWTRSGHRLRSLLETTEDLYVCIHIVRDRDHTMYMQYEYTVGKGKKEREMGDERRCDHAHMDAYRDAERETERERERERE